MAVIVLGRRKRPLGGGIPGRAYAWLFLLAVPLFYYVACSLIYYQWRLMEPYRPLFAIGSAAGLLLLPRLFKGLSMKPVMIVAVLGTLPFTIYYQVGHIEKTSIVMEQDLPGALVAVVDQGSVGRVGDADIQFHQLLE